MSDDGSVGCPDEPAGRGRRRVGRTPRRTGTRAAGWLPVLAVVFAIGWDLVALVVAARAGRPPAADARWAAAVLAMSAWFWLVFGLTVRSLRRLRAESAEENARRLAAATARAADAARRTAGVAYFQALHDTVVATLVVIARGGLDHRAPEVRQRCARDAHYLRRLLLDGAPPAAAGVGQRLAEAVAAAEGLGLRVHYRPDPAPAPVPPAVAEALGEATREALNNVLIHAGVPVCWVTVLRAGPVLTVRVVDRGRGFRPERARGGFGLPVSIAARMRAAGGTARVHSAPGEGTTVDLSWPA